MNLDGFLVRLAACLVLAWRVIVPYINGGARNWLVGIPTGQFFFSKHTKTGANRL
jgi:hypothetical protein